MYRLIAAAFLFLACTPAHAADWWEAETEHFIVISRDSEDETREFAVELEKFDFALRTLRTLPTDETGRSRANKVMIFRFGDTGDIAVMAGAPGSGIAGFYIPRAGASVAYVPARQDRRSRSIRRASRNALDGMSVLKHEYAHHFMMQYFPGAYPRWYVEGYAELVASIRFLGDGHFHVGDPPQYRARQVLQMSQFPLKEMLDDEHELTGRDAYQHYGTGWLLSHYLNFDEEARDKLALYLTALAEGEPSLPAAERIFGDIGELQDRLMKYRHGNFPGFDVAPPDYQPPKVTMRELRPDEEEFVRAKMRLRRGVTKEQAADVRGDILADIGAYPDSLEAHLLLAEASYDAEEYAAAEQAAIRAVEIDPDAVQGWLYRGLATLELAKEDPSRLSEARQHFADAAALDQSDPRALIQYYRSFLEMEEYPSENAILALEAAYDTAGSDSEYRLLLGRQLLTEKRFDAARSVIMPVAFSGHATGEADADEGDPTPKRLLKAIDDHDGEAAIEMIDEWLDPDEDEDGEEDEDDILAAA